MCSDIEKDFEVLSHKFSEKLSCLIEMRAFEEKAIEKLYKNNQALILHALNSGLSFQEIADVFNEISPIQIQVEEFQDFVNSHRPYCVCGEALYIKRAKTGTHSYLICPSCGKKFSLTMGGNRGKSF